MTIDKGLVIVDDHRTPLSCSERHNDIPITGYHTTLKFLDITFVVCKPSPMNCYDMTRYIFLLQYIPYVKFTTRRRGDVYCKFDNDEGAFQTCPI